MPEEKKSSSLKVTDKRLFTADGDIREEFRESVQPADPSAPRPTPPPPPEPAAPPQTAGAAAAPGGDLPEGESLFMGLVEILVYQAVASLQSQDVNGARQFIDIIDMLAQKTAGNLTAAETKFLESRRGELKLAYVQRTKRI